MEAEEPKSLTETIEELLGPGSLLVKALGGTIDPATGEGNFTGDGVFNLPEVRAAQIPSANGVTNARSLARMYAATIGTVEGGPSGPLLTPEQLGKACELQTHGADSVLVFPTTFGLGYMVSSPFSPYGGAEGFGHSGAGGSVGFADPEHGIALRLRDEPHAGQPQRRPPQYGPREGGLRRRGRHPRPRLIYSRP